MTRHQTLSLCCTRSCVHTDLWLHRVHFKRETSTSDTRPEGCAYLVKGTVWDFTFHKKFATEEKTMWPISDPGPRPNCRIRTTELSILTTIIRPPYHLRSNCMRSGVHLLPWHWLKQWCLTLLDHSCSSNMSHPVMFGSDLHAFNCGTQCVTLCACRCTWVTFNAICWIYFVITFIGT